ncbi:hypothetical protein CONCODRAFT_12224 [Conidiobolus coronatus NRRL 28638]|uniref:Zn(2)-C6 fungal-type domain-containing protein n=1 Tax=Conidiobolus coronatus (strain ATCC 28846 / CBS 209.66 / NRRL 28638) TaxID=796925 RepID=A0A137NTB4_CONC2|nr:hypothetical protein CONCODRAFT_12224 [Conidiobolus coronatus NRRL 28638]|eukprot:KXN66023.1 hypothetical protein CONCODRAFT_12224 [Conidiobolus coronatus NRRL 28638]
MPKVTKEKTCQKANKKSELVTSSSASEGGEFIVAPRPCDRCRKHRIRCDRNTQQCLNCKKKGLDCTYNDIPKKRGPKPKILSPESGDIEANNSTTATTNDCSSSQESVISSDNLDSQVNSPISCEFSNSEEFLEEDNSSLNSPNLSDITSAQNDSLLYNEQLYLQQQSICTTTNQVEQFNNLCYTAYSTSIPSYIGEFQPSMTYPQNIYKPQQQQNVIDCTSNSWSNPIFNQYSPQPLPFDMTQYYPLYQNPQNYIPIQNDLWLTIPHINQQQLNTTSCPSTSPELAGLSPLLL